MSGPLELGSSFGTGVDRVAPPAGERETALARELASTRRLNEELQEELGRLQRAHDELEHHVEERTRQFEELNHELSRTVDELKRINYVASHDLQEPLRTITLYVQLLEGRCRTLLPPSAREYMGTIIEGATRMRQLIRDLLEIGNVEQRDSRLEETDVGRVFTGTLRNVDAGIRGARAVITHDPLPTLRANRAQMGQLLQNLLDNALKYRGDEPPRIHLSAIKTETAWHFCLHDNGIGIDPKYADKIFLMFQRLHVQEKYPGTGVGLSICKKIVERHGGRIWVESQLGQGASFHFEIPIRERAPAASDKSRIAS